MRWIAVLLFTVGLPFFAEASDLEDLAREGYAVVAETHVEGSFEGCDFDKHILLTNGLVFVCATYSYTYSYRPEVLILKNVKNEGIKILINNREYRGNLYRR